MCPKNIISKRKSPFGAITVFLLPFKHKIKSSKLELCFWSSKSYLSFLVISKASNFSICQICYWKHLELKEKRNLLIPINPNFNPYLLLLNNKSHTQILTSPLHSINKIPKNLVSYPYSKANQLNSPFLSTNKTTN